MSASASQALELLLLQNAQQFGLESQRDITHFVQKECAFVGRFETTELLRNSACERALLMAKKFTFQEIERNSGAIQLYKRASAPGANVVNSTRDQFLAGPGFALNQNGRVRWRDAFDLLENHPESRALAYDLLEPPLTTFLSNGPDPFKSSHREPPGASH